MSEKQEKILKYGNLPAKEEGDFPRYISLVYLIGPYKTGREGCEDPLVIKSLTMVDPAIDWFEIIK